MWQRSARGVAAAVVGVCVAAVLTATAVWASATRPVLLHLGVEDTTLYRLAVPPIAAELRDSDIARRVNGGPLRLTRRDIEEILRSRFEPGDLELKSREVHAGLVRYVRAWPADTIFRISIRRERPILARAAERRVLERFQALSECGLLDDVETLGRAGVRRIVGGSSDEEFLRELPDCRPPEAVAVPLMEGVQEEFDRLGAEEHDSVDVFPEPEEDDLGAHAALIERVRTIDGFLGGTPWAPLAAAAAAVAAVALAGRRSPALPGVWLLLFGVGVGLLAAAGILHGTDGLASRTLYAFGAPEEPGSEVSRMWLDLARYGVDRALWTAGSLVGAVGFFLALTGAFGSWAGAGGEDAGT